MIIGSNDMRPKAQVISIFISLFTGVGGGSVAYNWIIATVFFSISFLMTCWVCYEQFRHLLELKNKDALFIAMKGFTLAVKDYSNYMESYYRLNDDSKLLEKAKRSELCDKCREARNIFSCEEVIVAKEFKGLLLEFSSTVNLQWIAIEGSVPRRCIPIFQGVPYGVR